jgi:hypothetical protein
LNAVAGIPVQNYHKNWHLVCLPAEDQEEVDRVDLAGFSKARPHLVEQIDPETAIFTAILRASSRERRA